MQCGTGLVTAPHAVPPAPGTWPSNPYEHHIKSRHGAACRFGSAAMHRALPCMVWTQKHPYPLACTACACSHLPLRRRPTPTPPMRRRRYLQYDTCMHPQTCMHACFIVQASTELVGHHQGRTCHAPHAVCCVLPRDPPPAEPSTAAMRPRRSTGDSTHVNLPAEVINALLCCLAAAECGSSTQLQDHAGHGRCGPSPCSHTTAAPSSQFAGAQP